MSFSFGRGISGSSGSSRVAWSWEGGGEFDSSEELSLPSGVESESNSGSGERRLDARGTSRSSSSRSTLERFLEGVGLGSVATLGRPVWGPLMLRTDE